MKPDFLFRIRSDLNLFGLIHGQKKRMEYKSERVLSGLNKTNKYSFHIKKDLCLLNPECVVMMSSERRLAALCMVEARVADPDPVGFETFWPETGRKKGLDLKSERVLTVQT